MVVYMGGRTTDEFKTFPHSNLQPWIHRLALERQHAEHTLVHPTHRLAADESLEPFDPEGELPKRERPLGRQAALTQTIEVFRQRVFRTVDDPQIFPAATLHWRTPWARIREGGHQAVTCVAESMGRGA
jgi:hypothetical protein